MMSINPSDMGFLSIKSFDYPCIISSGISKTGPIKLMQMLVSMKKANRCEA